MRTLLRLLATLALLLSCGSAVVTAQGPRNPDEQTLFDSANKERVANHLKPFRWDPALARAAARHAQLLAKANTLSHQLPGEAELQMRARAAGASFHVIAENVAEAPTAAAIHAEWMHSPPHRANILDKETDSIGIGIADRDGMLFAVADFSATSEDLSLDEQEQIVGGLLATRGVATLTTATAATSATSATTGTTATSATTAARSLAIQPGATARNAPFVTSTSTVEARNTCEAASGYAPTGALEESSAAIPKFANANVSRADVLRTTRVALSAGEARVPRLVARFETSSLAELPDALDAKVRSGNFHAASVGACAASDQSGFTRYRFAVLLF